MEKKVLQSMPECEQSNEFDTSQGDFPRNVEEKFALPTD